MLVVDIMLCRSGTRTVAVSVFCGYYVVLCAVCRTGAGTVALSFDCGILLCIVLV